MGGAQRGRRRQASSAQEKDPRRCGDAFPLLKESTPAVSLPASLGFRPKDKGLTRERLRGGGESLEGCWLADFTQAGAVGSVELISQRFFDRGADKPKSRIRDHNIVRLRVRPGGAGSQDKGTLELAATVTWDDFAKKGITEPPALWAMLYDNDRPLGDNVVDDGMDPNTPVGRFRLGLPSLVCELSRKSSLAVAAAGGQGERSAEMFQDMLASMEKRFGAERMEPGDL